MDRIITFCKAHWHVLIIIPVIGLLLLSLALPYENKAFNNEAVQPFCDNWTLVTSAGNVALTLPCKLNIPAAQTYTIEHVLTQELPQPSVLCFRTVHQDVEVFYNGQSIYRYAWSPQTSGLYRSNDSAWNLVRLPKTAVNDTLQISFFSAEQHYQGVIGDIVLGTKASSLFYIIGLKLMQIGSALVIAAFGSLMIFAYLFIIKDSESSKRTLYCGIFALNAALWLACEAELWQFISGNLVLASTMSYVSLFMLPITALQYVRAVGDRKYTAFMHYCWLQAGILSLLLISKQFRFFELVRFVHLSFVVCAALAFYHLLCDLYLYKKNHRRIQAMPLALLFISSIAELIWYYISSAKHLGKFLSVGFIVFLFAEMWHSLQMCMAVYDSSRSAERFAWLASRDALTKCLNRRALNDRIDSTSDMRGVTLVMFDLNGLKYINDTLGHTYGDEAIIKCAQAMENILGGYGQYYRLGGDEFIFWADHIDHAFLKELLETLSNIISQTYVGHIPLGIAYGYAAYTPEKDTTLSDTLRRADSFMYRRKQRMKQQK